MSKYRILATVAYSGFLFGDLRKNIPQIVGGLVSKQIVIRNAGDFISDVYVDSKEQVANYAIIEIDLDTLHTDLIGIEEYRINSSMKRPLSYYADLACARKFIQALNQKGETNG